MSQVQISLLSTQLHVCEIYEIINDYFFYIFVRQCNKITEITIETTISIEFFGSQETTGSK